MGEINFNSEYVRKLSTAGKKKINGEFCYTRDSVINYVKGKVYQMMGHDYSSAFGDLIIDCALVSHGQGVRHLVMTNNIEK